jgi:hypothetical protein
VQRIRQAMETTPTHNKGKNQEKIQMKEENPNAFACERHYILRDGGENVR